MTSVNLQQWIQHPEILNRDTLYELRNLVARYPYFQSIRLLYLKNLYLLHDINFGTELRKAVLYIADRRNLFHLIEGDRFILSKTNTQVTSENSLIDEPTIDRTLTLIDAFLSTATDDVASQTSLDYTMDYTTYLLEDSPISSSETEDMPKLHGHELIDGFLERSESEPVMKLQSIKNEDRLPVSSHEINSSEDAINESEADGEEEDESCFTETLAKIYVKQQRYSKALEIIKKLSLKYPKKNAYFADQIRFLEKLIINANSK